MDKWRHLPAYQLERRADIFFSLYLIEIIYLQPNNHKKLENIISFHEAAKIIEHHPDAPSQRLAQSLWKWADVRAGDQ